MASFLYISDVFCAWCYGFTPTLHKALAEYNLDVHVMCGALHEEPLSLKIRSERVPNTREFIEKMHKITGVQISDAYVDMLTGENNENIFMDSLAASHLFYSLRHFAPKKSLEIIESMQNIFYAQGQDVFSKESIHNLCIKFSINIDDFYVFFNNPLHKQEALDETELTFEIMNDVVLYPCLYYIDEQEEKHFVSRGFLPFEELQQAIAKVINPSKEQEEKPIVSGMACSLDGTCS